jgi:PTS system cellobiose-specific IIA component
MALSIHREGRRRTGAKGKNAMDNENQNPANEQISMELIANAGDAKMLAKQALDQAREGKFDECDELLKQADEAINKAHKVQMDLLTAMAQGKAVTADVLLVHAQDHLMTTMVYIDMVRELEEAYRQIRDLKQAIQ